MTSFSELPLRATFYSPFYNEDFLKTGVCTARFETGDARFKGKDIDFNPKEQVKLLEIKKWSKEMERYHKRKEQKQVLQIG